MLIDSNLIIYSATPEFASLRQFIAENRPAVSAITQVEVLGYHRLTEEARRRFEEFFAAARVLPLDPPVLEQAIRLRQTRKMGLGDALIAGTALRHGLRLATRNTDDFRWVPGLVLVNPLDASNGSR